MLTRRGLLGMALASAVSPSKVFARLDALADLHPQDDEWAAIRELFDLPKDYLFMNSGGICPTTSAVIAAEAQLLKEANVGPSYVMWRQQELKLEEVRTRLAKLYECETGELAVTRNATEALNTVLLGLDLQSGDEVLTTQLDYPRMITALRQRERRNGIKMVQATVPTMPIRREELVEPLERAITEKTKLILVSHVSFINGLIFPIEMISALGKRHGIPVVVDGAHGFAQLPATKSLGCEYYGTALHKWLLGPIGTGFLYVRKDLIRGLWPLQPADAGLDGDIRKFEQFGTHPAAVHNALLGAIDLHERIGQSKKAARLNALRERWTKPLMDHPKIRFHSPFPMSQSLVCLTVGNSAGGVVSSWLMREKGIYVTTSNVGSASCIRVSPNIFHTMAEMDRVSAAILEATKL